MESNKNKPDLIGNPALPPVENLNSFSPVGISAGPVTVIPSLKQSFVEGSVQTPAGVIPRVSSLLTPEDRWGSFKCRLGAGRMHYAVDPGLYALGAPDEQSPVLVTANYKMSFDVLRQALPGRSAWILVLDTKGINVWCAAGKGTFGTYELIHRLEVSGVKKVVKNRKIIVPQLGAPGVAAHTVKQFSGFKVYYGPAQAADLPAYLDAGLKATPEMRVMPFLIKDRAVLIPVELTEAVKPFIIISFVALLLAAILGPADALNNLLHGGLFAVLMLAVAIIAGAVLSPILLPWIPGRAFSVKGLMIGLIAAAGLIYWRGIDWTLWAGRMEAAAWLLMVPAISAYLAMNFTGCSTYTSLSGVKKEMRFALPAQISAAALGVVLWITSLILS
ncbi:MAG TPA: mercury methylation corrinoid protein HgcA [Smithellaceae bacterium]|nr:mercury methylation corrinoid protein HgcA [Smithellaceae bacterium]